MAISLCILVWVQNELSFDRIYLDHERIFRITAEWHFGDDVMPVTSMPYPLADELVRVSADIDAATRCMSAWFFTPTIRYKDLAFVEQNLVYVDDNWFEFFREHPDQPAIRFPQKFSVILSEQKAKQLFGEAEAVGKVIDIDDRPFEVAAITKNAPNSSFQFDVYLPTAARLDDSLAYLNDVQWGNWNYKTFIKSTSLAASDKIHQLITETIGQHRTDETVVHLELLQEAHFNTAVPVSDKAPIGDRRTLWLVLLIGGMILFSSTFNYVNLTLAQIQNRQKEVGLRKLLGGHPSTVLRRFIIEGGLVVFTALGLALLLLYWSLPGINQIIGYRLEMNLGDPQIWLLIGGLILTCLLLTSVYPAIQAAATKPIKLIHQTTSVGHGIQLRTLFVTLQFAISALLIICTLIVMKQHQFLLNSDLGYSSEHVFSIKVPLGIISHEERPTRLPAIRQQLLQSNAIVQAAFGSASPINMKSSTAGGLKWTGKDPDYNPKVFQLAVSDGFQPLLDLELLEGTWFLPGDEQITGDIILNEVAAKHISMPQLVGQKITFQGEEGIVRGIVKNFHFHSLHAPIEPLILFKRPSWCGQFFVKSSGDNISEAIAFTEQVWQNNFPGHPFSYSFLDEEYAALYRSEKTSTALLKVFALFAILISSLGLVGLALHSARSRWKEIAIRKVLGATRAHILWLISRQFFKRIGIALAIAGILGYYFTRGWLDNFAFVYGSTYGQFVIGMALMAGIALVSVVLMSYSAANANPVDAISDD